MNPSPGQLLVMFDSMQKVVKNSLEPFFDKMEKAAPEDKVRITEVAIQATLLVFLQAVALTKPSNMTIRDVAVAWIDRCLAMNQNEFADIIRRVEKLH